MKKELTISIDEDIYEKFIIALNLTKTEEDQAIEQCMRWYIAKSFEEAISIYQPHRSVDKTGGIGMNLYGMANRRIPSWATKPDQYNHRIIRAFFMAGRATDRVYLADMERICNDLTHPETYVPTFRSNYAQMKLDAPKSHGKVFEDDGETVIIWNEVKDTLMKYKHYFIQQI